MTTADEMREQAIQRDYEQWAGCEEIEPGQGYGDSQLNYAHDAWQAAARLYREAGWVEGREQAAKLCDEWPSSSEEDAITVKLAEAIRVLPIVEDAWCFVCDRPKNDCGCLENGGNY